MGVRSSQTSPLNTHSRTNSRTAEIVHLTDHLIKRHSGSHAGLHPDQSIGILLVPKGRINP